MTPKEKARYLYDKFINTEIEYCYQDSEDPLEDYYSTQKLMHSDAKGISLMFIAELFSTGTLQTIQCGYETPTEKHIQFWDEVKKEIDLL